MDETTWVNKLIERTGGSQSSIGDDCAVIEEQTPSLLITTDSLNRDIHFDDGYTPKEIGTKLAGVNESDIAAMGGIARWAVSSINTNRPDHVEGVLDGLLQRLTSHGVSLVGGDYASLPGGEHAESYQLTLVGTVDENWLQRSTAQPGDQIAVTGTLGGPAAVLSRSINKRSDQDRATLASPPDRLSSGRQLVGQGIRCGMDISDGLIKDLGRICRRSGVGAQLNPDTLEPHTAVKEYAETAEERFRWMIEGGEDYELLFTIPGDQGDPDLDCAYQIIGEITESNSITWESEPPVDPATITGGYDHFQPDS